jgi:DNA repair exonuclease SbcCD ATPase subunit
MDITNLKIENFLTIGSANLALSDKGLVLIQGQNDDDPSADSNGAGKSSIPDALCWALYGETARGVKGDSVVNITAKKGCRVAVTIRDGDEYYLIARHRKHKTGKSTLTVEVTIKSGTKSLTKGTDKLTQEVVNQIMGCSPEVFRAAVYAGQEAMPDLPGMTDKQLKMLIEESAGIDRLQAAYVISRTKAKEADDKYIRACDRRDAASSLLDDGKIAVSDQKDTITTWNSSQAIAITAAGNDAKKSLLEAKFMSDSIDHDRVKEIVAELAKLQVAIDGTSLEIINQSELRDVCGVTMTALVKVSERLKHQTNTTRLSRTNLNELHEKIGSNCGECGKVHQADDMKEMTTIAQSKLNKDAMELKRIGKEAATAQVAYDTTVKVLDDYVESMTDVSEVVGKQGELHEERRLIDAKIGTLDIMKTNSKAKVARVAELKSTLNPHEGFLGVMEKAVETRADTVRELLELVETTSEEASLTQEAVKIFGPAGVRAHILDTVTPFLNERTSHYLGAMSDGNLEAVWNTLSTTAKGELREKFNIEVSNRTGADSFGGLSGGEKRKVRLASSMALQDMVASRATKPINIFIADEVDHALDQAGLERLMSVLDEKARDKGTVLVISHNSLSDWIRNECVVVKSGGIATVEGYLS